MDRGSSSKKRARAEVEAEESKVKDAEVGDEVKSKALNNVRSLLKISEKYSLFFKKKLEKTNFDNKQISNQIDGKLNKLQYFTGTLKDYQVEGVLWLKMLDENGMNGILADEMGLGKTVQIIAFISLLVEMGARGPYIVLAPLSTIPNWRREFERFAPKLPVIVFHGTKDERKLLKKQIGDDYCLGHLTKAQIILTTYTLIVLEEAFFQRFTWRVFVLDEGQKIKNYKSKLHGILSSYRSNNRIILSGTPIQNDLTELFSLLNFLMPRVFNKIDTFSLLLGVDDVKNKDVLIRKEEENNVLSKLHAVLEPFILRRLKADVNIAMVPKKEICLYCPLTSFQKTLYKYALERRDDKENVAEQVDVNLPRPKRTCASGTKAKPRHEKNHYDIIDTLMTNKWIALKKIVDHPFLIKYPLDTDDRQELVTSSGKMKVLDEMLKRLKQAGHKVLIFSTFVEMLNILEDLLNDRGYEYRRIDGNDVLSDRDESIENFNGDPEIFVFLLSTRAGGVGLNLVAADTVIFYDRDWNPQVDIQAQDRCHRIGQTKPVIIYTLVAKNTIDEHIIRSSESKKILEKLVIGEGNFKSLSNIGACDRSVDIKELKNMLDAMKDLKIVQSTGTFYTDKELDALLDRSDLYDQLKK